MTPLEEPKPDYDPDYRIKDEEYQWIKSQIRYDEDNEGDEEKRRRLTSDAEILQWVLDRRIKVISLGSGQMAWQNDIYWFKDGVYENCNSKIEQWLRQKATEFDKYLFAFSTHLKSNTISDVINKLKQTYYSELTDITRYKAQYIAFKNGLLSVKNLLAGNIELQSFDPEIVLLRKIPHNLMTKPNGIQLEQMLCPTFLKHFHETVGEDWIKLQFEIIGYLFVPGYPLHKFFVLYGPHNSGKSTFARI